MTTIHLPPGDYTSHIQKRQLGQLNIGFYCDCGEFFALLVIEPSKSNQITVVGDGRILFTVLWSQAKSSRNPGGEIDSERGQHAPIPAPRGKCLIIGQCQRDPKHKGYF
jgi:hypothetical protein